MGGYVGQAYAQLYPDRLAGFISIDSAPLQRNYVTAVEIWLLKRMEPVYAHYPWKLLLKSGTEGVATGVPEYVVTLKVSEKLKSLLEQNNYTVVMTKTQESEDPGNIERAEVGNNNNADLVIRIHCDGIDDQSITGASMLVPAPIGYAANISSISEEEVGICFQMNNCGRFQNFFVAI